MTTLNEVFAPILGKLDGLRVGLRIGTAEMAATIVGEVIAEISAVLDAITAAAEPEAFTDATKEAYEEAARKVKPRADGKCATCGGNGFYIDARFRAAKMRCTDCDVADVKDDGEWPDPHTRLTTEDER